MKSFKGVLVGCIIGKTGAGKTEIQNRLNDLKVGTPVVSATSRIPRDGEIEGVDYYFLTRNKFIKQVKSGLMMEWAEVYGNLYGVYKTEIKKNNTYVFVCDYHGYQQFKDVLGEKCISILIDANKQQRWERTIKRDASKEEVIKMKIRFSDEDDFFRGVNRNVDYTICNDNGHFNRSVGVVIDILEKGGK